MSTRKLRPVWLYATRRRATRGQGYVEYILIIALVSLVTATALTAFQTQIAAALGNLGTSLLAD